MEVNYNIYSSTPILETRKLNKSFGENRVLTNMEFKINYGEVVSIIGPSGAGKSTLLRCLSGLEKPTSGKVIHKGRDIFSKRRKSKGSSVKIGMVFQNSYLFENMTVLENCMIGVFNILKDDRDRAYKLTMDILEKVGMKSCANMKPNLLSSGQRQKIAIARALVMKPEILLLDYPTGEVGTLMTEEVLEVITNLVNEGMTMIIVTDDIEFAKDISTHVVFMNEGYIVEEGSPEVLFNKPKNLSTSYFLDYIGNMKESKILINY